MGIGPVCGRVDRGTWPAFSAICRRPTWPSGALNLPRGLSNVKIIDSKKVTFNDVEAIVPITQALPQLIWRAGTTRKGLANLYLHKTTVNESVSQGASRLQPFHPKDVSTVPGCIHPVLRSTLRWAS